MATTACVLIGASHDTLRLHLFSFSEALEAYEDGKKRMACLVLGFWRSQSLIAIASW